MRRTEWKKPYSFSLSKPIADLLFEMSADQYESKTAIVERAIQKLYKSYKRKLQGV